MIIKRFVFLLIFSLAVISSIAGQQAAAQTPTEQGEAQANADEQQKAQQELEKRAVVLLDEIIADAKTFKTAENRVLIKIAVADLLWSRNEARARALYKEAASNFNEVLSADADDSAAGMPYMDSPAELRRSLIQSIARHDPLWARELLRSTRTAAVAQSTSTPRGRAGSAESDLILEQNIASQIAASDPKQALEVAEQTLAKGLSFELLNTLNLLLRKDREAAARLSSKIVTKLQTENLATNDRALQTAISLLSLAGKFTDAALAKAGVSDQPPMLSQQEMHDLAEMVVAAAINRSSDNLYPIMMLKPLLPEIEKYAPTRITQLRSRIREAEKTEVRRGGMGSDLQEVLQNGTVEATLDAAPKAPEGMRNYVYQRAASKAMEQGDSDRARQIIEDNIADPAMRRYMLAEIEQQQIRNAVAQGNMEQMRQMLSRLRTNEERVTVITTIAMAALAKGDKKAALTLLDEARSMVSGRAKNSTQLGAQLQVARAYARLDPARSLAILEPIIDQLNELIGAGALLGGFFSEQFVKDDEIQLIPMNSFAGGFAGQFAPELKALASADFDRTKAAADRFQRNEVRLMARLLIAQSILAPSNRQGPAGFAPADAGVVLGANPFNLADEP
jgi:hypothetical protein